MSERVGNGTDFRDELFFRPDLQLYKRSLSFLESMNKHRSERVGVYYEGNGEDLSIRSHVHKYYVSSIL
ncbi:hypothetical protein CF651_30195 [Paenibacillus rigui]|uniref:Uncharacterized protein n=1 Tax=Paenibacillus rigui TaxID=554312 RepID=A0A229UGP1_9BACL|nr:hypothetical protein CF651_30195 [Paenibacillus rigui]